MTHEEINIGDKLIYIPPDFRSGDICVVLEKNLGIVTSKNDRFIFVRYKDHIGSQATEARDLYSLKDRPDLAALIEMKIKPLSLANFDLVEIKNGTPHCKLHGAMNKTTKNMWRCITVSGYKKVINGNSVGELHQETICRAGCEEEI